MDTLSHALWGRGFFGYKGHPYWSLFFGVLPDLFSFGIFFLINLFFTTDVKFGKPSLDEIPNYVFHLYDITHSLIIALFFIFLVYKFINKRIAFAMLAWPLHIMLDFPFHTADFFPTPILWPVLEVKFDGVSWSKPVVWFSNVGGIVLLYIYRYTIQNKTKKLEKK